MRIADTFLPIAHKWTTQPNGDSTLESSLGVFRLKRVNQATLFRAGTGIQHAMEAEAEKELHALLQKSGALPHFAVLQLEEDIKQTAALAKDLGAEPHFARRLNALKADLAHWKKRFDDIDALVKQILESAKATTDTTKEQFDLAPLKKLAQLAKAAQ